MCERGPGQQPPTSAGSHFIRSKLLPVLVVTAAHSRFVTGQMIPTRKTEEPLLGTWELIKQLGRFRAG